MRSGMRKSWNESPKTQAGLRSVTAAVNLPAPSDDAKMAAMKPLVFRLSVLLFAVAITTAASAQTFASGGDKSGEQLDALTKKIDEQNAKIDALSQQILKLEQQLATVRPGIMIGESTPPATSAPVATPAPAPASGNTHIVTKGETLTSIAKANRVGVQELQRFNHIENDRALQIGQTIVIPTPGATPAPSATPLPND